MSTPLYKNTEQDGDQEPVQQDTIFDDVADMSGYDKNLRTARIYLYIVAALQAVAAVIEYYSVQKYNPDFAWVAAAIDIGVGLIFIILAVWSHKKPAAAFLTALIAYIVVHILAAIGDTSNIYSGIILKVLVIIALVKGYKDAREYEEMKRSLGASISD